MFGGTHQALEDIALMRIIPNMTVLVPCDSREASRATVALADRAHTTPAYLRLCREKTQIMTEKDTPFIIGKAYCMYHMMNNQRETNDGIGVFASDIFTYTREEQKRVSIIGCGPILIEALYAAKELQNSFISVSVWNFHTIKPLDTETLDQIYKDSDIVVIIEEHQRAGGLGSAILEYMSERDMVPTILMGVDDRFGQSGSMVELYQEYALDRNSILQKIKEKFV